MDDNALYERIILPLYAAQASPVHEPTAIVIGGQPGAGKSGMHAFAQRDYASRSGIVSVVGDDLRAFHPEYRTLATKGDPRAIEITQGPAGEWLERLTIDLLKARRNIAVETTMRQPDKVTMLLREMRAAGATKIEVWAMAVNERVSYQSTQLRNESLHLRNDAARDVPKDHHDRAAKGLIDSLNAIEHDKLADRIIVLLRGGQMVYDSSTAVRGSSAVEAIQRERARPLSTKEAIEHDARWHEILKSMRLRHAHEQDIERIERQREQDQVQIAAERSANDRSTDRSR